MNCLHKYHIIDIVVGCDCRRYHTRTESRIDTKIGDGLNAISDVVLESSSVVLNDKVFADVESDVVEMSSSVDVVAAAMVCGSCVELCSVVGTVR
jgi:hypothetical protein